MMRLHGQLGMLHSFGGFSLFDFIHWAHACCHEKDILHDCDESVCQSMQYLLAADVIIYYFHTQPTYARNSTARMADIILSRKM